MSNEHTITIVTVGRGRAAAPGRCHPQDHALVAAFNARRKMAGSFVDQVRGHGKHRYYPKGESGDGFDVNVHYCQA
jgi:hypothetical protein